MNSTHRLVEGMLVREEELFLSGSWPRSMVIKVTYHLIFRGVHKYGHY